MSTLAVSLLITIASIGLTAIATVWWMERRARFERVSTLRATRWSDRSDEPDEPSTLSVAARPPAHLIKALQDGHCVLVVGAGVVVNANRQRSLVVEALRQLLSSVDPATEWDKVAVDLDYIEFAATASARLGVERIDRALRDLVDSDLPASSPWLTSELAALPFAASISMLYTDHVERRFAERDARSIGRTWTRTRATKSARFEVLHPLGVHSTGMVTHLEDDRIAEQASTQDHNALMLTAREALPLANSTPDFRRLLSSLAATSLFLFVGMGADEIIDLMRAVDAPPPDEPHIAFLPHASPSEVAILSARFRISLLKVEGPQDFARFVRRLRVAIGSEQPSKSEMGRPIQRLRLENIGPFHDLDLDLDRGWTVLLGDNGVGKSTVLRALALALSGAAASKEDAPSLLRSGAISGSITVEVDGVEYRTELQRDRSEVALTTRRLTPVESGRLLALGFSSLRGATTPMAVRESRPPLPVRGGDPGDLTSLRRNQIDLRLDEVRQWLVGLAVVREDQRSGSSSGEEAGDQLALFFDLIDALVPGEDLRFHSLDTETWELNVTIGWETVPLTSLSQGMLAALTWAGTVTRRLFETYRSEGAADSPAMGLAVVLLDEIDLHLHPAWQQRIVAAFRLTFPNVQVIATTHSPLVVGSLADNELFEVARIDRSITVVPQPSFRGWRSDQILTSDAFGLTSSRDPITIALRDEYEALLGLSRPTDSQASRRDELERRLAELLPSSGETQMDRSATSAIDAVIASVLSNLPATRTAELERAVEKHLRRIAGEDRT